MYTTLMTSAEVCTLVAGFGARRSGLEEDHQTVKVPSKHVPGELRVQHVPYRVSVLRMDWMLLFVHCLAAGCM